MTAIPAPVNNPARKDSGEKARPDSPPAAPVIAGLDVPRRNLAIGAVLSAMSMVVVDGGVSTFALPALSASLRVHPSEAIVVMTAYQAAVVMMLLPSAALGERFGYRRVFAAGVAIFATASLASALAPSLPWLIASRFVQGLGGAAILALGVALLRFSVSDARLGAAIGWNALTVALSAAVGPAIGAVILSSSDWRWLYVANIPVGLAILAASRALPLVTLQTGRLDAVSMLLNCAVFGLVIVAANVVPTSPFASAGLFLLGALALAMLVKRERSKSRPLVPIDLLRRPSFAVAVAASIFCFTGQTAGLVALPFYLQHGLALTPALAGFYMTVWPLSVAAAAPLAGRLLRSMPAGRVCAIGAALLTTGLVAIALWPVSGDPRLLAPFLAMSGAGFGLFQVANNRTMFLASPPARSAAAGGMQGTARLMGQTAGTLLVAQLFALVPCVATPQLALGAGAVFTLAAGLVSLSGTLFHRNTR